MIWLSSRKIPGMDSQTKTLIQLNAPQVLYLWRLAWLCQIAAYVQQQSTKAAIAEPKPLQGKKSPEQECNKEKQYVTVCCIKKKWSSVRRCTSSVPIFANGALSGAFGYLFNQAAHNYSECQTCDDAPLEDVVFIDLLIPLTKVKFGWRLLDELFATKSVLGNANYAQKTFGETFSAAGKFAG